MMMPTRKCKSRRRVPTGATACGLPRAVRLDEAAVGTAPQESTSTSSARRVRYGCSALHLRRFVVPLLGAAALLVPPHPAVANDAMFPAQTAAAGSVSWKNNCFLVNGKPTILSSGEIRYARVPREL